MLPILVDGALWEVLVVVAIEGTSEGWGELTVIGAGRRPMTLAPDDLTKSEAILVAAIEGNVPELVAARKTIGDFQSMIR